LWYTLCLRRVIIGEMAKGFLLDQHSTCVLLFFFQLKTVEFNYQLGIEIGTKSSC
jgi:hypothetical protein